MQTFLKHKLFLKIVFSILLLIFVYLSIEVYEGSIFETDLQIFRWLHSYENDVLTNYAIAITFLGSQTFLLPANIILATIFLFRNKKRLYVWKIALISLSSAGFLFLVKYIIKRPRPESPLINAIHYSFPSGHTFTSITFFGLIVYFSMTYIKSAIARGIIIVVSIFLVLSIAWSRVYLYVHYASDVLASACLGLMWLIMAKWFLLQKKNLFKVTVNSYQITVISL